MVAAIVFDFDGVICDSETQWRQALEEAYEVHGVVFPEGLFEKSVGAPIEAFDPFSYLRDRADDVSENIEADIRHRALSLVLANPPLPGIVELTSQAQREGVLLGIASNALATEIHPYLRAWGLNDRFQAVVSRSDGLRQKPAPDAYQYAVRRLQVDPAQAVAFEDSRYGIEAAVTAQLRCIGVVSASVSTSDLWQAHAVVHSIADVSITADRRLMEHVTRKELA